MKKFYFVLVLSLSSLSVISEVNVESFTFERSDEGDKTNIVVSIDKTSNVRCTIFDKNDRPIKASEDIVTAPLGEIEVSSNMAMITSARCYESETKYEEDNNSLMLDDQLNVSEKFWVDSIAAKVRTYWRFSGARSDWSCFVYITQGLDGKVNTVKVDNCGDSIMNIDDNPKLSSFKNSIERAVYKASPFPLAPTEAASGKQIIFEFRVDAIEIM